MLHKIDAQRPGIFEILSRKAQQLDGSAATATLVTAARECWSRSTTARLICSSLIAPARAIVKASSKYQSVGLPPDLTVGAEYGLTVAHKAVPGAADFVMYLLSPQGQSSLQSFGFIPVALPAPPH